jgi:hypothetical protein
VLFVVDSASGSTLGCAVLEAIVRVKGGCVELRAVKARTRGLMSWLRSRKNEVSCLDRFIDLYV